MSADSTTVYSELFDVCSEPLRRALEPYERAAPDVLAAQVSIFRRMSHEDADAKHVSTVLGQLESLVSGSPDDARRVCDVAEAALRCVGTARSWGFNVTFNL